MGKYYVVLSGAIKNVGDFLITDQCKKLIKQFKPDVRFIQVGRGESLDNRLYEVNNADAIIILGGPGYIPQMYPNVYKLVANLERLKPPIIPMGVGWNMYPGDYKSLQSFVFDKSSLALLHKIAKSAPYVGCRDFYSYSILKRHGVSNALVTGCPALYNLDYIGQPIRIPKQVKTLAFTPGQDIRYSTQTIGVMKVLRKSFPNTRIICAFHRGLAKVDTHTDLVDAHNTNTIAQEAIALDMETIDLSYNLEKMKIYDGIDLHVGYRVHAHIYFLSMRRPSLLIHEDGRGKSISETIGVYGVDAFQRKIGGRIFYELNLLLRRFNIPVCFKLDVVKNVPGMVEHLLLGHVDNGFKSFFGVSNVIDANFEEMKKFIMALP